MKSLRFYFIVILMALVIIHTVTSIYYIVNVESGLRVDDVKEGFKLFIGHPITHLFGGSMIDMLALNLAVPLIINSVFFVKTLKQSKIAVVMFLFYFLFISMKIFDWYDFLFWRRKEVGEAICVLYLKGFNYITIIENYLLLFILTYLALNTFKVYNGLRRTGHITQTDQIG